MASVSKDMAALPNVSDPEGKHTGDKLVKLVTVTLRPVRSVEKETLQVPRGTTVAVIRNMVQHKYGVSRSAKFLKFLKFGATYMSVEDGDKIKKNGTLYITGVAWLRDPTAPPREKLLAANPNAFMANEREGISCPKLAPISTAVGGLQRHELTDENEAAHDLEKMSRRSSVTSLGSASTAPSSHESSPRGVGVLQHLEQTPAKTAVSVGTPRVIYAY